jgi:hypothetical protein
MQRPCEVCTGLANIGIEPARSRKKIRRVLVGDRIVALCDDHAEAARSLGFNEPDELRSHFMEPGGRRSLVGRRSPLDRRVFPVRPEGRRRSTGRRRHDVSD